MDAIVLDLMLPGRSGFDILREIRASEKFARIPVLVLTVKDLSERERQVLSALNAPVFEKGPGWRPALLQRLQLIARASSGKKVLVVDDNPAGRELVRECLQDYVSSIMEAANGREALEKLRTSLPDLVLLDIQMPEMDGYEVLREIRRDPALKGSARGGSDRVRHARRSGTGARGRLRRLPHQTRNRCQAESPAENRFRGPPVGGTRKVLPETGTLKGPILCEVSSVG